MKQILRFVRLAPQDRNLFLKACLLLSFVRFGLFLRSFNRLCKFLERFSAVNPSTVSDRRVLIHRVVWAIDASCKLMPGTVKCLARALTMKTLLDMHNCPSTLMIGVDKNAAKQLEAHAWVEYEGHVVMGQLHDLSRFKPLPSLPQFLYSNPVNVLD
jgi:hypothetical protein